MRSPSLKERLPLQEIRHVLLDMDGTLLDRHFDDYFWRQLLPERYAAKKRIPFPVAQEMLLDLYRAHEGTLNWTDIDFWSREVDIDIPALKAQISHLIEVHPHVEDFLDMLRHHRKKVYLVTNAHYKVLDLKMRKTLLGRYFDDSITSFEIGYPKEMIEFWEHLQKRIGFDKERTLFIDDTEPVLETAAQYGIRHILHKSFANSRGNEPPSGRFPALADFRDLMFLDEE